MVVIKRGLVVEADKNFSSQLRLMNLSDGSPYETLHAFVSNAVAPYFKSYVRATGKADRLALRLPYFMISDGFMLLFYVIELQNLYQIALLGLCMGRVMHGIKATCNVWMQSRE